MISHALCLFLKFSVVTALSVSVQKMKIFRKWAKEEGVQFASGISLEKTDFGWGIVQSGVMDTDIVLRVPRRLAWNAQQIQLEMMEGSSSEKLEKALNDLDSMGFKDFHGEFILFVKLLLEVHDKESSECGPWLDVMPKDFTTTGLGMSTDEKECLTTFCRAMVETEELRFGCFSRAARDLVSTSTTEERMWAYNIICSRSWRHEPEDTNAGGLDLNVEMVPVGDMFNHRDPESVIISNAQEDEIHFCAKAKNSKGELYLSYGLPASIDRFLIRFGFVDEATEYCFTEICFTDPSPELVALGCQERERMVVRCEDGALSNAAYDCILYALLEQHPAQQNEFYRACVDHDADARREFQRRYGRPVAAVLANHFRGKLEELSSLMQKIKMLAPSDRRQLLLQHNSLLTKIYTKAHTLLLDK